MGELHLEIVKDRILKEYNLNVYFGPLNIGKICVFIFNILVSFKYYSKKKAYKETPTVQSTEFFKLEKSIGQKNFVEMELKIIPRNDFKFESVKLAENKLNDLNLTPTEVINAIDRGVQSALNKG